MKSNIDRQVLLNRCIFILALIGFTIAAYVTHSFVRQTGILCINTGCELVRKSPASYIFGIPVPSIGLVGYAALAICAFLQTTNNQPPSTSGLQPASKLQTKLRKITLGIATFGILFVSWFTYTEIFVIKGICTWCVISAFIMVTIFVLALLSVKKDNKKITM